MISIIKKQIQGKNGNIIGVNEKLYDFTLEYLKSHKYVSSRTLARAYHNIKFRKPSGNEKYGFSRVISALKKENIVVNHSRTTNMRVD